jgi:hypothetical protein
MKSIKLKFHTSKIATRKLLRQHDEAIMSAFSQLPIRNKDLIIVNNVRLFLQVTAIREISNNNGNELHQEYCSSTVPTKRPIQNGTSLLKLPQQPPPNKRMWRIWKKWITQLCKPNSFKLKNKLGAWNNDHSMQRNGRCYQTTTGKITHQTISWEPCNTTYRNQYYQRGNDTHKTHSNPVIPFSIGDTRIIVETSRSPELVIESKEAPWYQTLQNSIVFTWHHPPATFILTVQ